MAGRRDNNEGGIGKRSDGRWEARVSLPDGKRKSFYGKTKDEAKQKMKQALKDIDAGLPVVTDNQPVGQFLSNWIQAKKPYLRYSTWRNYRGFIQNHVVPAFEQVPLRKLATQQVQLFYAALFDEDLSSSTVQAIHRMLKSALQEALRLGLVQRNVLDVIKAPRRAHHEMVTLTERQVRGFLVGVSGDWFEALYVLALSTGMREGELLGLRWQDIDFEKGDLLVRMAASAEQGRVVLSETKTQYSRRRIALTRMALDALRYHRSKQDDARRNLGAIWRDSLDLVFPSSIGTIMNPSHLRGERHFKRHLRRLGLPDMRFHDLRHTCATLLLSRDVNIKVVSELLGHADVAITLRVYGHVLPHMQDKAVREMEAILGNNDKLASNLSSEE